MKSFLQQLRMLAWMTVLTGLAYPLAITAVAYFTVNHKAQGSIVYRDGKAVGSRLIAQKFEDSKYFWSRPSANDYNGLSSGGSNLGPTSAELKKKIQERQDAIIKSDSGIEKSKIPAELLFASGSGLDPHITPKTAEFQIDRIAKTRGLNADIIAKLVKKKTNKPKWGFIGTQHVNVLELNMDLDEFSKDIEESSKHENKN